MAVSTTSYFSNSIVGVPQVAGEAVDLFESRTTPRFALGTKFERQDGAIFRYAYFLTATSAGMIMAGCGSDSTVAMVTSAAVAPTATYQMPNEQPGVYPGAAGSRYFVCAGSAAGATFSAAVTANQFAGAYITISSSGTGTNHIGYTYRVKGNTASGAPATGLCRFELYDTLQVAMSTNTTISIVGNKFNGVVPIDVNTSKSAAVAAGVVPIIQAASRYGWVQTRGMGGVLLDGNAALGSAGDLVTVTTASGVGAGSVFTTVTTAAANNARLLGAVGVLASAACNNCVGLVDISIGA